MSVEKVHIPVRVLADCGGGQVTPLRFLWGERTCRIDAVNGRWIDRSGDGECLHYSVQVGDETVYLHFDLEELQWWLDQVVTPG